MKPDKARAAFEKWAKEGTRPYEYNLAKLASDEYVSTGTETAWRVYRAGWLDGKGKDRG